MFHNADSLKGYIKNESKKNNMTSQSGYIYFFTRQFLTNMFQHSKTFAITGNIAQASNIGRFSRPITDMDIISGESIQTIIEQFYETLKIKNNGISFGLLKKPAMSDSGTLSVSLKGSFEHIQQPIGVDLKAEPPHQMVTKEMPKLFSKDEDLELQVVSLNSHLARKLYVIARGLYMMTKGYQLTRYKDFFDVFVMSEEAFDPDEVMGYYQELMTKNDIPDNVHEVLNEEFILAIHDEYAKCMKAFQVNDYSIIDHVSRIKMLMENFEKKSKAK